MARRSPRGGQAGIELARSMYARVTAFTAVPEVRMPTHSECVSRTAIPILAVR